MRASDRLAGFGLAVFLAASASAQVTQRVSLASDGTQGDDHSGHGSAPSISADGRYVAFASLATNLVTGDANAASDVFVRDRLLGTTELVSANTLGQSGNQESTELAISSDGRFVAFRSFASDLVASDTNGTYDIFVRDRLAGTTERVSVDGGGAQASGPSQEPAISADGHYVAFASSASNLVPGDTNGQPDVFVRDRQSGTTERVSVSSGGAQASGISLGASLSSDGRYVAFGSGAANLVPGDVNGFFDVFVRDRQSSTTEIVSVSSAGVLEDNSAARPISISGDGSCVAFSSLASNLVPGDTNLKFDVFLRDRTAGTTERVSVATGGAQGSGLNTAIGSIAGASQDGRFVVFSSDSTNLVPGDTNAFADVCIRDRQSGTTARVSLASGGAQGDAPSFSPSITPDGRYVALASDATSLVPGDTNGRGDVFVRDLLGTATFTSLCDPGAGGAIACPCGNAPAGQGRGCENSSGTGGAVLAAAGGAFLSSDSLVFTTSGEKPSALSILLQGKSFLAQGAVYGQGVRCVGPALRRLFSKSASGGSITAPDFGASDPTLSSRSAAKGDVIHSGESRWYLVYYRDPIVLGGCPAASTFNATQTGRIDWSP